MLLVTISVSTVGALEPTLPQYWLTESYTASPILIGLTFSGWAAGYTIMMPFVCTHPQTVTSLPQHRPIHSLLFPPNPNNSSFEQLHPDLFHHVPRNGHHRCVLSRGTIFASLFTGAFSPNFLSPCLVLHLFQALAFRYCPLCLWLWRRPCQLLRRSHGIHTPLLLSFCFFICPDAIRCAL